MRQFAIIVVFGLMLAIIADAGLADRRFTLLTLANIHQTSGGFQEVLWRIGDNIADRAIRLWQRLYEAT